jgi:hypothetical protein
LQPHVAENGRPEKPILAALYCRASTAKKIETTDGEDCRQRPEIQEDRLRRLCDQRGWVVADVYCDRASGRKETHRVPAPKAYRVAERFEQAFGDVFAAIDQVILL